MSDNKELAKRLRDHARQWKGIDYAVEAADVMSDAADALDPPEPKPEPSWRERTQEKILPLIFGASDAHTRRIVGELTDAFLDLSAELSEEEKTVFFNAWNGHYSSADASLHAGFRAVMEHRKTGK